MTQIQPCSEDRPTATVLVGWTGAGRRELAAVVGRLAARVIEGFDTAGPVPGVDLFVGGPAELPTGWDRPQLLVARSGTADAPMADIVVESWSCPALAAAVRAACRVAVRERALRGRDQLARLSGEMLADARRAAQVGVWVWHVASDRVECDGEAARWRGQAIERARTTTLGEHLTFVHAHDRERAQRAIGDGLDRREEFAIELRLACVDGNERRVRWVGRVVRDPQGVAERLVVTERDVTERQASAAELRESRTFLELALRAARVAAWRYDPRSRRLHASAGAPQLLGLRIASGRTSWREWLRAVHPADRSPAVSALRELRGASRSFRIEHRLAQDPERWFEVAGSWTPLGDAGDVGPTGTIQEVTARRQAESHTQRLDEQLRHVQKLEAVGRLASGVAHDFNNVLTAILGHAQLGELAARDVPGASAVVAEHHRAIEGACRRAIALTRRLLQVGRREPRRAGRADLFDAIGELEPVLRRLVREDIHIRVQNAAEVSVVELDRGALDQVLMNLVVNACDAMPEGGRLTVSTADQIVNDGEVGVPPGRYVRLAVSDTGVGIPAADLERVFEPFYTTKTREKGTGLGLSIIQGIVSQAGGTVLVASEPGKGTRFDVLLPVASPGGGVESDDGPPGAGRGDHPPDDGDELILVCEDETEVRNSMVRMLTQAGYEVLEAADAIDALEVLASSPRAPEILVTDVVLPGAMSGPRLARTMSATHPDLAVLFVSGYSAAELDNEDPDYIATRLLSKPFRGVELLRHVRAALDRRRVRA